MMIRKFLTSVDWWLLIVAVLLVLLLYSIRGV